MSCEQDSNRVSGIASRIGAGMARLANKRGFYAGLALGGAGLVPQQLAMQTARNANHTRQPIQ